LAISPESITQLFALAFLSEYQLLIQHWGLSTFLLGLALIVSLFKTYWQEPVFLLVSGEKIYMVMLVLYNHDKSFASGFMAVAIVDAIISFYLLAYLFYLKKETK